MTKDSDAVSVPAIPGYSILRVDRHDLRGGMTADDVGLLITVRPVDRWAIWKQNLRRYDANLLHETRQQWERGNFCDPWIQRLGAINAVFELKASLIDCYLAIEYPDGTVWWNQAGSEGRQKFAEHVLSSEQGRQREVDTLLGDLA